MFPPIHLNEINPEEQVDYQLKPMNCPFHILIYKNQIRSYKDLPLRYTELGTVYRYERSGTLHGLARVRGFTQDDAHIWCTPQQLDEEINNLIKLSFKILRHFGFDNFEVYLSTRPEKYVGTISNWNKATKALEKALKEEKIEYSIDKGGGAFYGPKIDIKLKDALGRSWQCTTIQVDFNLPQRFEMFYIDQKGKKQQPIMIHRALLGSIERFMAVLIEHYAGDFPFWLAPVQIMVLPVLEKHALYAQNIVKELKDLNYRVDIDLSEETLSKRIRNAELNKIPYILVIGDREMANNTISVRERGKGDLGAYSLDKFISELLQKGK
jgi:threonyl-tRNA synthetase (EC 6.1.1.3)/Ser-tRNA(Thr) hydrolase (EC 3.1.1.-)